MRQFAGKLFELGAVSLPEVPSLFVEAGDRNLDVTGNQDGAMPDLGNLHAKK